MTATIPDNINAVETMNNLNVLEILKETRLSKKISPAQAAHHLNIQKEYLQAIEDGDLSRLPERVYVLGYVRMYANYLGLEAREITEKYKKTVLRPPETYHYEVLRPLPEGGVPRGSIIIASLGLLAAVYFGWQYISDTSNQPLINKKQATSENEDLLASLDAVEIKESPTNPSAEDNSPDEDDSHESGEKKDTALAHNSAFITPKNSTTDVQGEKVGEDNPGNPSLNPEDILKKIKITATDRAWIEVRDKNGEILYSGIMKKGESFDPPKTEDLLFSTGNAGGVIFEIGSEKFDVLGKTGQVIRRIPLTPDALKNLHKKITDPTD